jgi:hypothetical protein
MNQQISSQTNSKDKKIKNALFCLYGVGLVQIALVIYQFIIGLKILFLGVDAGISGLLGFSSGYSVIILVALYFVIKDLGQNKPWAWAVLLFFFSSFSFSLPFCVVGIINLLDEELRSENLAKLKIKM